MGKEIDDALNAVHEEIQRIDAGEEAQEVNEPQDEGIDLNAITQAAVDAGNPDDQGDEVSDVDTDESGEESTQSQEELLERLEALDEEQEAISDGQPKQESKLVRELKRNRKRAQEAEQKRLELERRLQEMEKQQTQHKIDSLMESQRLLQEEQRKRLEAEKNARQQANYQEYLDSLDPQDRLIEERAGQIFAEMDKRLSEKEKAFDERLNAIQDEQNKKERMREASQALDMAIKSAGKDGDHIFKELITTRVGHMLRSHDFSRPVNTNAIFDISKQLLIQMNQYEKKDEKAMEKAKEKLSKTPGTPLSGGKAPSQMKKTDIPFKSFGAGLEMVDNAIAWGRKNNRLDDVLTAIGELE